MGTHTLLQKLFGTAIFGLLVRKNGIRMLRILEWVQKKSSREDEWLGEHCGT